MQYNLFTNEQAFCQTAVISIPRGIIKVCPDPTCEQVHHNCDKKASYCSNCGHRIMEINEKTYLKKFVRNPFQVDFKTDERVFPEDFGYDPGYTEDEKKEMQEAFEFIESLKQTKSTN